MDHYDFVDKVHEICRTPRYKAPDDDKIIDMLMKEVKNRRSTPGSAATASGSARRHGPADHAPTSEYRSFRA